MESRYLTLFIHKDEKAIAKVSWFIQENRIKVRLKLWLNQKQIH